MTDNELIVLVEMKEIMHTDGVDSEFKCQCPTCDSFFRIDSYQSVIKKCVHYVGIKEGKAAFLTQEGTRRLNRELKSEITEIEREEHASR